MKQVSAKDSIYKLASDHPEYECVYVLLARASGRPSGFGVDNPLFSSSFAKAAEKNRWVRILRNQRIVSAIRNIVIGLFAPWMPLCGPLWASGLLTVTKRCNRHENGRQQYTARRGIHHSCHFGYTRGCLGSRQRVSYVSVD